MLSKAHLIPGTAEKREKVMREIEALLKKLNPEAKVLVPKPHFADVALSDVCNTGLFDMNRASASAGWKQELSQFKEGAGHTPETEEYGITSLLYRNFDRPFHPGRLAAILNGFGNYASSVARSTADAPHKAEPFQGVVRSKG